MSEDQDESMSRPRTPSFHWFKDGVEFDAADRFKCQFDDEEDSLALLFQKVTPDDAGLYTCIAKTSNGKISCSAELTVQGDVRQLLKTPEPPEVRSEVSDVVASQGTSAMIEASISGYPKPQITWLHDDEEVVADSRHKFLENEEEETYALIIKNVQSDDSGAYAIKATNELGDVQTMGKLSVTSAPKVTKRLENKSLAVDDELRMEIEFEGSPIPQVKWFKDGSEIEQSSRLKIVSESETKQVLVVEQAAADDSGNYSVDISNSAGQQTVFAIVSVKSVPRFVLGMKSLDVKEGEPAEFEVKISATSGAEVKFMKDGKQVEADDARIHIIADGTGGYKLVIDNVSASDVGEYTCVAKTESGCQESRADLKITSKPLFKRTLSDCEAREGDQNIDLSVTVEGSPKPKVRWFINSMLIEEKSDSYEQIVSDDGSYTLRLKEAASELAGTYSCSAENSAGKSETSCRVTITSKAKFTQKLHDINLETLGSSFTFTASVEGLPTPDIQWFRDGVSLESETEDRVHLSKEKTARGYTYSLSITESTNEDLGEYECKASNCFGSVSSKAKVACDVQNEKREAQEEETHEEEQTQGTTTDDSKTDADTEEKSAVEDGGDAGKSRKSQRKPVFTTKLSDVSALHDEENITLEVGISLEDGEPQVRWFIDDIEIVEQDGRYLITRDDDGAKHKLLIRVADEGTAGAYKCVASNDSGDSETTAEVTVSSKPQFMQGLEDRESLAGESISMDVVISGNPAPDVKWLRDGKEIAEGNNITIEKESDLVYILTIEKVSSETIGLYECHISNRVGAAKSSGQLLLLSKPTFEKDLEDASGVMGENGCIEVIVNGFPRPSISWFKDGEKIPTTVLTENPDNHFRLKFEPIEPEDAAEYYCEAKNRVGGLQSKRMKYTVQKPKESERKPTFSQGLTDTTVDAGKPLTLTCFMDGEPKPTLENIKWFKDGNPDAGRILIDYDEESGRCTLTLNDVADDDLGDYKCQVKTSAGTQETSCRVSGGIGFEKPKFKTELTDTSVELNETDFEFVIELEPNQVSTATIRWFQDGVEITDYDSRFKIISERTLNLYKLIIRKAEEKTVGTYKCTATNKFGSSESSARLSVSSPPKFIEQLKDKTLEPGMDLSLRARISGSPKPLVKWLRDGQELLPDQSRVRITIDEFTSTYTLTIMDTGETDLGQYSCQATNSMGSITSTCKVSGGSGFLKPNFRRGLHDMTVKPDDCNIELVVELAPSKVRNEVKWFFNDIEISRSDERFRIVNDDASGCFRLTIRSAEKDSIGSFKFVAGNDFGKARTACRVGYAGQRDRRDIDVNIPERQPIEREPFNFTSESQYVSPGAIMRLLTLFRNCSYTPGPDTMLLQHRDPDYPMRVREYLRVGARYSPSLANKLREPHWGDVDVSSLPHVFPITQSDSFPRLLLLSLTDWIWFLTSSGSAREKAV